MNDRAVSRIAYDTVRPIEWIDGQLRLIDQRCLPGELIYLSLDNIPDSAQAITDMVVRGAPAIGITAAYAVALGVKQYHSADPANWRKTIEPELELLIKARPTAVNLPWAVMQMRALIEKTAGADPTAAMLAAAQRIHANDIAANHTMGRLGAELLGRDCQVITHCNAGALATGGYGTALGVVRAAYEHNQIRHIYADETRPWLQGARLTAWELMQEGIPVEIIADGAAAYLMQGGKIDWAIVGSDRIAANGDVANKIGTYSLALAARHHGVKFMVVAPTSTIDMATPSGAEIPIEIRSETEVLHFAGQRTAPDAAHACNPAFDITPAELIDVIITEKGVVKAPDREKLAAMMGV